MVNAIAHIHIKPTSLPKKGFVAGGAAAVAVAGRRELEGNPARRGGRGSIGEGAGRAWWLWERFWWDERKLLARSRSRHPTLKSSKGLSRAISFDIVRKINPIFPSKLELTWRVTLAFFVLIPTHQQSIPILPI